MGFADDLLKKLFPKKESDAGDQRLDSGMLVRTEKEVQAYEAWRNSSARSEKMADIGRKFDQRIYQRIPDKNLDVFESPGANGLYLNPATDEDPAILALLLDYFRDRGLELGYRLYTSDHRAEEKGDKVVTIHRHYLKPPMPRDLSKPAEQLYGNLLLELTHHDRRPNYLTLLAQTYHDRRFAPAQPFPDLIHRLIEV